MSDITVTLSSGNQINVTTSPLAGPLPELQIAAGDGISIVSSGGVSTISATSAVVANLADLSDVSDGATAGQVLSYNGSVWGGLTLSIPSNIADLGDVTANATAGQILAYDGSNWAATDVNSAVSLSGVGDVSSTSPAAGQALTWNGTAWSPENVPVGTTINGLSGGVTLVAGDNINLSVDGQNITVGTIGAASISELTDLTDVNASMTPSQGQALVWDGSAWTADAVTALVSNGTTLDLGIGRILYSNVYQTLADLPDAASYHGMFAHVHSEGAAYYAHAGGWVRLADATEVPTDYVSGVNGLTGSVILAGGSNVLIGQSGNQLTISSTQTFSTLNGESGSISLVGSDGISIATTDNKLTVSGAGLASESYVDQAVANLVNSSPQTLDTLSELAQALNNDADFATTVTTSLAGKAALNHTHTSANITDFAAAAAANAPIQSVNGLTGELSLVAGDNINVTTSGQNITITGQQPGIAWQSPPTSGSSPGNAGDIAYDNDYLYLRTSQAWRQVALSPIATSITISQQPSNQSVDDGQDATFTVLAAAGDETVTYQWEQSSDNGSTFADVGGATSNSLTVAANLSFDGYQYRASLSAPGAADVTSEVATLTVAETFDVLAENGDRLMTEGGDSIDHDGLITLTITQQPQNTTAAGGEASFAVAATVSDGSALTYQWEEERSGLGEVWTQQTLPGSSTNQWNAVAYGGGVFVAVRDGSSAATSTDGVTWTLRDMPSTAGWKEVAYGNGTFVAVGHNSNYAVTSADGIAWTQRTLPSTQDWQAVSYGNGRFVAVGQSSNIAAISLDGVTWTQATLPSTQSWMDVTYGNGIFVAVAFSSNIAATSADGSNWTQRTLSSNQGWVSVAYGGGAFVAVSSTLLSTSTDGIIWVSRSPPSGTIWRDVTYGNGTFVAIRFSSSDAATSTDGITWERRDLPVSALWASVAYGNDIFVAVALNSNIAAVSTDALQFIPISGETSQNLALTGLTTADDGERYRVVVDSPSVEPVTSDAATLSVLPPATITFTTQPQNATVLWTDPTYPQTYRSVTLSAQAEASDGSQVQYDWQELYNGQWVSTGQTTSSIAISAEGLDFGDQLITRRVIASSATAPDAISNVATVSPANMPTVSYATVAAADNRYSVVVSEGLLISWKLTGPGGQWTSSTPSGAGSPTYMSGTSEQVYFPVADPHPVYHPAYTTEGTDFPAGFTSTSSGITLATTPGDWPAGAYTFEGVVVVDGQEETVYDAGGTEYTILLKKRFKRTFNVT